MESGLFNEHEFGLFADLYELTSGKADLDSDYNPIITEEYFVRKVPPYLGSYLVFAGLEQAIHFILSYKLDKEDRKWLEKESKGAFGQKFLDYLENFEFKGEVMAVPEGTVVFPNEPMLTVTGKAIDVQLFETYLLNVMNFQTLIATKASRVVDAARGKAVIEFGARRAHGRDAAILGARASYIGGTVASSMILASKKFGIPYSGTMPHKFVQERNSELQSFRDYAKSFPDNAIFLIDTYDTLRGAKNACTVGEELRGQGYDLKAVRIDSGDLFSLSREVRKILDDNGFTTTKIIASSDLDEYLIDDILKRGAPIDMFGVGTRLITGANYDSIAKRGGVSALGGVYKLMEIEKGGKITPKLKVSNDPEKTTLPGKKQVYRLVKGENFKEDLIALSSEKPPEGYLPMLIPIVKNGHLIYGFPTLMEIRKRSLEQISLLPKEVKLIRDYKPYTVKISKELTDLKAKLIKEYKQP